MAGSVADHPALQHQSGVASPRLARSRTQSLSSDRPSTIGHSLLSLPLSVSPEPAFIASSAASQIVTNDHDSHADAWYDQHGLEPAGETALVSPAALSLVNNFLDQLLFNFLQVSRATTLVALRPAVSEVLKPKLAKDAINNADEELREYLGGGDEEDYVQPQGADPSRDWDLELVWKRTRLRCMVYSSLGDMEEEDEDIYMEQENLEIGADEQISDVISPAVAIFLTSVLEYMGEMTLTVAGQAAYHRMRVRFEKDLKEGVREPADLADRIVVEDADMERVALDRTLGRLWRGWKKRIRSPAIDLGARPFPLRSPSGHSRHGSNMSDLPTPKPPGDPTDSKRNQETLEEPIAEYVQPSDIPLPIGDRDVDEIEVPGLAAYSDDEDEDEEGQPLQDQRPRSLLISPSTAAALLSSVGAHFEPVAKLVRQRSNSLPTSRGLPYSKWVALETSTDDQDADEVGDEAASSELSDEEFQTPKAEEPEPSMAVDAVREKLESVAEDPTEDAIIEEAEIVTSARVSLTGSTSPESTEGGQVQRSSSVRSARIVDVPGRRSLSSSRPGSIDAREPSRPASLSSVSVHSAASNKEEHAKATTEDVPVVAAAAPVSMAPADRLRPAIQHAATISESEEENSDGVSPLDEDDLTTPTAPLPITAKDVAAYNPTSQTGSTSYRKPALSRQDHYGSATKGIAHNSYPQRGALTEEPIPEIPPKAPSHTARQLPKGDSIGVISAERTRTMDSDDLPLPPTQANTSPRQIHTSGSSASSATGRLKAVRTSEDQGPNRAESVARNFEELIQSNETITYTLTPESMRDPNAIDSPVLPKFSRKSEDAKAQSRSRSSSAATEAKSAPIVSKTTAISSHPLPDSVITMTSAARGGSGPRSPRLSGAMARDPRAPPESTATFAEFIKSTGPPEKNRPQHLRNVNGSSSNNGLVNGSSVKAASPTKTSSDLRRISTNSNRMRYQPRDAAVDSKADNSDLIDFIRQGPPSAATNHRIPRHVAPFRNTMDSDQMASGAGGKAVDAAIPEIRYSQASTSVTENSMPSMPSSMNSNSALLKNRGATQPSKMFDDDDMMPKRKTRRVLDPYAIDFSDEEDEDNEFIATPKPPPAKKEESLAEFLRNYEPPPAPAAAPTSQRMPKKKSSAPSLMARFTRNQGNRDSHGAKSANNNLSQVDARSTHSSASRKTHVPIQVNVPAGYENYGLSNNGSSRSRVGSVASANGKVPMKKFEPREAVSSSSQTSELAAFLRDSRPPPGSNTPNALQSPAEEGSSSFSKMLGRRRKVLA